MILGIHIVAGVAALAAGSIAAVARKGGRLHGQAGTAFLASMLVLGLTAAVLEPYRTPPGSPAGGILVCYFVLTSWAAARQRDRSAGWIETAACVAAFGLSAAMIWGAISGTASTPLGRGPIFATAGLCAFAGALDLKVLLGRTMTPVQRISRHLWRMCFAFFIATGSFFLGQQQVFPAGFRRSALQFAIALAPFALMAFWLVRVRIGTRFRAARV